MKCQPGTPVQRSPSAPGSLLNAATASASSLGDVLGRQYGGEESLTVFMALVALMALTVLRPRRSPSPADPCPALLAHLARRGRLALHARPALSCSCRLTKLTRGWPEFQSAQTCRPPTRARTRPTVEGGGHRDDAAEGEADPGAVRVGDPADDRGAHRRTAHEDHHVQGSSPGRASPGRWPSGRWCSRVTLTVRPSIPIGTMQQREQPEGRGERGHDLQRRRRPAAAATRQPQPRGAAPGGEQGAGQGADRHQGVEEAVRPGAARGRRRPRRP